MTKIILDPTGLYQPLADYLLITNEVEWLQYFTLEASTYWIKGKRLCDWTEEWLIVWNKSDLIVEIKQHPRSKLEAIFPSWPIPNDCDDQRLLHIVTQLDSYASNHQLESLLADVTQTEEDFWLTDDLSVKHFAQWLCIEVPQDYQIFEEIWKHKISYQLKDNNFGTDYQIVNKYEVLINWLGLNGDFNLSNILGLYPFSIPDFCLEEFSDFWNQKIYQTEAKILDNLILNQQAGNQEIASIAYRILCKEPLWITPERVNKISFYLGGKEISRLQQKLPPVKPLALLIDASPQDALKWVTESYLPFRRWETTIHKTPKEEQFSEKLADSFVNWILKNYPELKMDHVEQSFLNYTVAFQVQKMAEVNSILWIVVDGLGWFDHQELIAILTKNNKFLLETDITPRFSILPTKTEYAKWSLYSQLLPEHSSWKPNAKDGFSFVKSGKRYTDQNKHELVQDLKASQYKIYCWDTDQLDELYHQEKDWETLYNVERINCLEGIARNIQYFLDNCPNSEKLKVFLSSDHGQMMGEVKKLSNCPEELQSKGRMSIGKTDDSRFVVLDAKRFGLPHDISIVRNSDCISAFNYTKEKEIIGSHGGLFPEEVVIGFSVLSPSLQRYPVIIACTGEGTARQQGELKITINNPNTVSLHNLCLYVKELKDLEAGKFLNITIEPNKQVSSTISITEYPELPPNKNEMTIQLSGYLTFSFANTDSQKSCLSSDSFITIKQIFSSGIQGGLDEFF